MESEEINEVEQDNKVYLDNHRISNRVDILGTALNATKRFTVLSLFSGCGGMDLGFKGGFTYLDREYSPNNFDIIWANEIDKHAAKTYRDNFGDHIVCDDIANIPDEDFPEADIVIGGFPCQDFSIAGKMQGFAVERGRLYLQMKRVIDAIKPKAFVAENVKNLMVMEDGLILKTIIDDFKESGYDVGFHLFHSANYGVPQNRERVIIYGYRSDLNLTPFIPLETHEPETWVTAREAIDDLWSKLDSPDIANHSTKDYSKAKFYEGKRTQGNVRIKPDKIAPTIRAEHHGNIEGHYRTNGDENDLSNWRRLTVRECARIQSFPDDFIFTTSASSAYRQVGNAVPPVLAWYIARSLYYSLTQE
jgi:DNA (cytosine-5)-methyltransferase 1